MKVHKKEDCRCECACHVKKQYDDYEFYCCISEQEKERELRDISPPLA